MSRYYDIDGNLISQEEAARLLAEPDGRTIGDDSVITGKGTFRITTAHVVRDHADGGPVPLLFESLVFFDPLDGSVDPESSGEDVLSLHWSTRQQAEDAHAKLVQEIIEQQDIPAWAKDEV
ncbi:hypothetical protein [Nonomuraea sp. NPDC049480]|uniref:hypothetical protein n=1 Tax=Nonomuraea sp. NPDC049480 TaxID=3364353 RepID=UPI0037AF123C